MESSLDFSQSLTDMPGLDVLRVGEAVEARYKGSGDFFQGSIRAVNEDGTYAVEYDDGDHEDRVAADNIRSIQEALTCALSVGDRVEARAQAGRRYYPGAVAACNDGTFDIHYDDGDKESKVPRKLIKAVRGRVTHAFAAGAKVDVNYKGTKNVYPGTVSAANADGTYDIEYDDGDKEAGVSEANIKARASAASSTAGPAVGTESKYAVGTKIEARYRGKSKYYPGTIAAANGGVYEIDYDDGEKESGVAEDLIRVAAAAVERSESKYAVGTKIEARYRGKSKYYPGTIAAANGGVYDIDYDDGEKESGVDESLIRVAAAATERSESKYVVGTKIEARYRGKSKYYPGTIAAANGGVYDIDYDDGEKESGVDESWIRVAAAAAEPSESKYVVGTKIEARYRGKSRYYPGKIAAASGGVYDIDYDDGEKESGVDESLIRVTAAATEPSESKYAVGTKIEARYRGKSRYYPGKIAAANGSVYDIDYDDGEKESGVDESLIRVAAAATEPSESKYAVGTKIEARYRGKSKYYPGKIAAASGGVYDIDYDDGEKESGVAEDLIRVAAAAAERSESKYVVGTKIEARYRGKSKYYPGKIAAANGGVYDIDYDDGEKESGVDESLIRVAAAATEPSESKYAVGTKIEARYRGKSKYYPGTIAAANGGVYDIDYDDGETESGVAEDLIRVAAAAAEPSESKYAVGTKIEARYRGKSKYYPGTIAAANGGVYDIDYDDGEKESGVAEDLIRVAAAATEPSASKYAVGTKIEARYRGKSKYYPGTIAAANGGVYDIDYDDGEKESGVDESLIRVAAAAAEPSESKYVVGTKIEARYRGKSKYYPGTIAAANGGVYDIDYDDGEKESGVDESLIRVAAAAAEPSESKYVVGTKIEARYRGKSKYYPGTIAAANGGVYDIDYDDGEKESGVDESLIRVTAAAAERSESKYAVGTKIEAQYRGKSKYYPGTIAAANGSVYDIDYDDGEKESGVAEDLIRVIAAAAEPSESKYAVGTKIEARYRGKSKYYPGTIAAANGGVYDIDYDDGEKESDVAASLIRIRSNAETQDTASSGPLAVGTKVDVRYRGKMKYYSGKIGAAHEDGTYDIDYDDGEKEKNVNRYLIRSREDAPSDSPVYEVGAKVEARYRGKSKFYPGTIAGADGSGKYDIDYDDGEKERSVDASLIKLKPDSSGSSAQNLTVGAKITARYRGKMKYYPGVISAAHSDGTYDVDYDDGEKETNVSESLIQVLAASPPNPTTEERIKVGAKVDARYRGKAKFYSGVIAAAHDDGTYDIDYDDGEKETGVSASLIKVKGAEPAVETAKQTLGKGTKVEARYRGKMKYYPGVIALAHDDGTYDIDYDDGEKETGVDASLIKVKSSTPAVFEVGAKIEARYRGKSKFYLGVVAAVHGDGTYDIDYDDGEKESNVAESLIKDAQPPKNSSRQALAVGAKVEARYRGKMKYYPGTVAAVHSDGTYDIDYDDGEKESHVDDSLIKQVSDGPHEHLAPIDESLDAAAAALAAQTAGLPLKSEKPTVDADQESVSALSQSQQSTNKLFAAASALKKSEKLAGQSAASNLAAAARDLENSADLLASAGLKEAARAVNQEEEAAAKAQLEKSAEEEARQVAARLRKAAEGDAQLEKAARMLAADAASDEDPLGPGSPLREPELHPGGLRMPWARGTSKETAKLAAQSLRGKRHNEVSRMQRTLLARSVTFGDGGRKRRTNNGGIYARLSEWRPESATAQKGARGPRDTFKDRLNMYGTYDDAAHCVFKPKVRGDPLGEVKQDDDDDNDGENNFVQRQDAWCRKVRKEKDFLIGKKNYDLRLDKKVCPSCGAVQAFDEFEQKRNRCVECGVNYVKPNRGNIGKFLNRLDDYQQVTGTRRRKLEDQVRAQEKGYKKIFRNGRIVDVPLFSRQSEYGWENFMDRLEGDLLRRRDAERYEQKLQSVIDARQARDENNWCTSFRPNQSSRSTGFRAESKADYAEYFPPAAAKATRRPATSAGVASRGRSRDSAKAGNTYSWADSSDPKRWYEHTWPAEAKY